MLAHLKSIPESFFSRDLYRRVAREWRGVVGYLLTVLLLSWGVQSVAAFVRVRAVLSSPGFAQMFDKLPHIEIKDGKASVDIPAPYVVPNAEGDGALAIVDTTGRTTGFSERSGPGVILLEDKVLFKQSDGQVLEFAYAPSVHVELDRDIARAWVAWGARWGALLLSAAMLVFGTLTSLVYRLALGLLMAALWMPLCRPLGVRLPWWAVFRVVVVAMTPAIVIDTVLVFAARVFGASLGSWVLLGALNVAMAGFGLWANGVDVVAPSGPGSEADAR